MAFVALGCLGCWQEIRYEHQPSAQKTDVRPIQSATAAATADPISVEPAGDLVLPIQAPSDDFTALDATGSDPTSDPSTSDSQIGDSRLGSAQLSDNGPIGSGDPTSPVEPAVEAPVAENLVQATPNRLLLATWQMSSRWSMAAALQAKGRGPDGYRKHLEVATTEAKLLGVILPELPRYEEGGDRVADNLLFLLEAAGPQLASTLSQQHGTEHAALAELATKTHVLLLSYTPSARRLESVIAAVHEAAQQSELPESVWKELVDLLTERADFKQVKAAIFRLHQRAAAHLRSAANG